MGRFPTQKAYGVTTNGTIQSLMRLGHKVTVFSIESPDNKAFQSHLEIVNYKETFIGKTLKVIAFRSFSSWSITCWKMYWELLRRINTPKIRSYNFDIVWIRNEEMLKWNYHGKKIICELHQKINLRKLNSALTRIHGKDITLAPISKVLVKQVESLKEEFSIVYSPMGIDSVQIANGMQLSSFMKRIENYKNCTSEKIRVGYVGKFFPNGYSKGIEDLIYLALKNKKSRQRFSISISGGLKKEVLEVLSRMHSLDLSENDLEVNPHMPHTDALKKMQSLDVIVLPKPNSENYVGFPLKCIEAVASARIVVAAKCQVYNDIFEGNYFPYWYEPGNPSSLERSINNALEDPELHQKISEGIKFAHNFTWDLRTSRLIENHKS